MAYISKFLTVGIDYENSDTELANCANDSRTLIELLKTRYESLGGIGETHTLINDDDGPAVEGSRQPTRANILSEIDWLVADAKVGDRLVFHYSGHGAYEKDTTGKEEDGYNETICPVDFESAGMILDDEISAKLATLPEGVDFLFVSDCCHSGSNADCRFTLRNKATSSTQQTQQTQQQQQQGEWAYVSVRPYDYLFSDYFTTKVGESVPFYAPNVYLRIFGQYWVTLGELEELNDRYDTDFPVDIVAYWALVQQVQQQAQQTDDYAWEVKTRPSMKETEAEIWHIAACSDDQTASDGAGITNGLFTHSFAEIFPRNAPGKASIGDILRDLRKTVQGKYNGVQRVELSTGRQHLPTDTFPF